MKHSPKEQRANLELAADYLGQARLQLIRCDMLEEQTVPTLERVAQLLAQLQTGAGAMQSDRSLVETLLQIRATAARTQLLLDAAATFHCGAALARPATADSYAPDGTWETVYPSDQICLSA